MSRAALLGGSNGFFRPRRGSNSIAEILKIQRNREIVRAHGSDDRLKIVPALGSHANLITENLRCDFQFCIADEACDLLRDRGIDALGAQVSVGPVRGSTGQPASMDPGLPRPSRHRDRDSGRRRSRPSRGATRCAAPPVRHPLGHTGHRDRCVHHRNDIRT